jgi:crossover junction endodeoxyribonuclease RuvC
MFLIGLDPGLGTTGWGVIAADGNRLSHVANGQIRTDPKMQLPRRLTLLYDALAEIIRLQRPASAAVEEVLGNSNAVSTLKLGQARGVVMLVPARAGLPVAEYAPNAVKKSVIGVGHGDKQQIHMMVKILMPKAEFKGNDAADALAIAICHAHNRGGQRMRQALAS